MRSPSWIAVVFLSTALSVQAQPAVIEIGVDGLTCSLCSKSVEMKLRQLDFVTHVDMDLENHKGWLHLDSSRTVHFERIPKAVSDAGFSVRYVKTRLPLSEIPPWEIGYFQILGNTFHVIRADHSTLPPIVTMEFIGPSYMSAAAWKKWKKMIPPALIQPNNSEYCVNLY